MSQEQLTEAMREFDRLIGKMEENLQMRNKLMTQQNENEGVAKELGQLQDDSVLYKIVGPVLVRQNREDATATVNKRLDYIRGELQRCDKLDSDMKAQLKEATQRIETLQKKMLDREKQRSGRI
ncbi:putative prefoldin subunit 6 [Toxoplasma gondii TgCatPRC2]|uniref:Prefoldin subunit, putative n=15 Tax=Toxoplasma gondii TaxID=5811 RepID=B9PQV8_TOXGV|nr:prefoldin subunit 6, putative [Toxoplasma gondii ME49]EPR63513.1 putative prefoldin subunit 6 [Toxoplasma gondii GT1]ESS34291.1 putative prefoldin subunit 6 [Toxoplasma gondii VEG]KAF4638616.1 putative prefoldin subunit 6 [Toxoplasma gondii]KFG46563.1 putative prefoldin subunit 6 [Toxoplasma gondii GAB2-2007-GAL-DOM2]KFG48369.1 putative prefoldin subunit 6 [Toxoplasma gondii p89]KFG54092.1 putative prefoldin subunit 6 [Toxoplasma gondii FOU]KFG64417.1 putative prefoldin subunit 6 [Toxopla|eukprot:XP_002367183.1 prefoldin subunit 6, putative [Toxoplasma gondii ME49]